MEYSRTTLRLKNESLKTLKGLSFDRNVSLTEIINTVLDYGLKELSSLKTRQEAAKRIDTFRKAFKRRGVTAEKIYKASRTELK